MALRRAAGAPGVASTEAGPGHALRGAARAHACRCCGAPVSDTFVDLGLLPATSQRRDAASPPVAELFHPLRALVCRECRLVQLPDPPAAPEGCAEAAEPPAEAARFAAASIARFGLESANEVAELGSGEGRMLLAFRRRGMAVLGLEQDAPAAEAASRRGIPTEPGAFGAALARRLRGAGHAPALIHARQVLAASVDPHDIAAGLRILLAPGGVVVLELPHLLGLLRELRIDAIRHDRLSYFSLATAELLLAQHGLAVFDVETPAPGVLRLMARHVEDRGKGSGAALEALRREEALAGLDTPAMARDVAARVVEAKCALLDFLVGLQRAGLRVAGYGAPPGAETLLGYCGVGPELLPFIVDPDPRWQGRRLAGSGIPVLAPDAVAAARPDFLLLLSWGARARALREMAQIRRWGGRFALPLPAIEVF